MELKTKSDSIDKEYLRLETLLGGKKQINDSSLEIISIKELLIKFQEEKVKLMQDDLNLELKQNKYQAELRDLNKEKNIISENDKKKRTLWDNLIENFEKLKGTKQILLKEDEALEKKSEELKHKFEDNRKKKESVIQSFERADSVERKIMQEFDNLKSKKKYIEDNIAISMYTQ